MQTSLLNQLKCLVSQIDDGCPCPPSCSPCPPCPPSCPPGAPPCPYPYVQVCMLTPPPCVVPTEPKYVKPLSLPCPPSPPCPPPHNPEEDYQTRYANFYNNYNVDYHNEGGRHNPHDCKPPGHNSRSKNNCSGVTVDGKSPRCEDYMKRDKENCATPGCPTGFKPCKMKLCGPPNCHPLGIWKATVQPCPPKPKKKVSNKYEPGPCTRPCCKHWKPKEGPCLYDKPCKAHCYDHPPGIKPSHLRC